jgi:hypothetical protein
MRTTIDLPEDLHRVAKDYAHQRRVTLSEAVAELMRRGIDGTGRPQVTTDPETGLKMVRLGHRVTSEDVWALEDDE